MGQTDNCFQILAAATTVDGFTITRGGKGTFMSEGGGIYIGGCWSEFPVITNCIFLSNSASYGGGAISNNFSSPRITNCTFWGNSAMFGGAIFNVEASSPFITNCTFSGNTAWSGGAIANSSSGGSYTPFPTITNSILWGDIVTGAGNPKEFHGITNLGAHSHNNIDQPGFAGVNGNIREDPIFVSGSSNLHLRPGSPCIDAGRNDGFFLPEKDMDGDPRIIDGDENGTATVDMGADEFDPTQQFGVWYVDGTRPSSGDGSSWGTAFKTVNEAVNAALASDEIWVKAGTYNISTQNVAKAVKIYGGFAGGETDWSQRNWVTNVTTVDGQNTAEPCFNVTAEATIDGLKITKCINYGVYKASPTSLIVENCNFHQNNGVSIYTTLGSATVNNCNFSENSNTSTVAGGAIYNYQSLITVTNSTFTNNHSSYPIYGTGGAIGIWSGSASISNSSFTGNTSESAGGAIYIDQVPGEPASNVTFTNCSFSGNSGYSGGALYNAGSSTTISNSTFNTNSSTSTGGAIRNLSALNINLSTFSGNTAYSAAGIHNTSSLTVTNTSFSDNATGASGTGGGIYSEGGSLNIRGCNFVKNKAGTSFGMGGGVYVYQSSPLSIVDSNFIGNTAYRDGGGFYYEDSSLLPEIKITNSIFAGNSVDLAGGGGISLSGLSPSAIANCTLFGNKVNDSSGYGGGIHNYNPLILTNSILWGNTANSGPQIKDDSGGSLVVSYCNIDQDGLAGINGNIRENPQFMNVSGADPTNWDLKLQGGSPCIDAGNNGLVPVGITTDVDGNPRIADGNRDGSDVVDMGAYEIVPSVYFSGVDFDGDRKTDISFYRSSSGVWWVTSSSGAPAYGVGWGGPGFKPIPGDYDGDGKADVGIYQSSNGGWWIICSSDGSYHGMGWGGDASDIPLGADPD